MYMIMKGGSLKPQELKDFLQASYEKTAPNNINGYVQDESLPYLIYMVKFMSIKI